MSYACRYEGMQTDLQSGLKIERMAYELTIPTEDRIEALNAFAEKKTASI